MTMFFTIDKDFIVREIVYAEIAVGFLISPRMDLKVGDVLTEDEQIICGLKEGVIPERVITDEEPFVPIPLPPEPFPLVEPVPEPT